MCFSNVLLDLQVEKTWVSQISMTMFNSLSKSVFAGRQQSRMRPSSPTRDVWFFRSSQPHTSSSVFWCRRRCSENEALFLVKLSNKCVCGITGSAKQLCCFPAPIENKHQVSSTGEAWNEVIAIFNQKSLVISLCRDTKLEVILSGLEHNYISEAFWI